MMRPASLYRGARLGEAADENARNQVREALGIDLARGVVPVVDPVHHSKQRVRGGAAVHRPLLRRRVLEQGLEQVNVAALNRVHAALHVSGEAVGLV